MAEEQDSLEASRAEFLKNAGSIQDEWQRKKFLENPNSISPSTRDQMVKEFREILITNEDSRIQRENANKPVVVDPNDLVFLRAKIDELELKLAQIDTDTATIPPPANEGLAGGVKNDLDSMMGTGWTKVFTSGPNIRIDTKYVGPFKGFPRPTTGLSTHGSIGLDGGWITMNKYSEEFTDSYIDVSADTDATVYVYIEIIYDTSTDTFSSPTLKASTTRPTEHIVEATGTQTANRVIGIAKTDSDGYVRNWIQKQFGHIYIGGGSGGETVNRWWNQDDDAYLEQDTEPVSGDYALKKGAFWMSILETDGSDHILNNHQKCVP